MSLKSLPTTGLQALGTLDQIVRGCESCMPGHSGTDHAGRPPGLLSSHLFSGSLHLK